MLNFAKRTKTLALMSLICLGVTGNVARAQTATFDAGTLQLTIPSVDIGGNIFGNVVIRLDKVTLVSVGSAPSATDPTKNDSLWHYEETKDVLSGKLTYSAITSKTLSIIYTSSLVVRCDKGTTFEVYVVGGKYIGSSRNPPVQYSVDQGTIYTETWTKSTDGAAAFSPSASAFAKRLLGGDVLGMVITDYAGTPISLSFPISTTYFRNIMGRCGL